MVKERDLGVPSDEESFADLLHEGDVVDEAHRDLLHRLRGLRNRIVHRYGDVDDGVVHENIRSRLDEVDDLVERLRDAAGQNGA